MDNVSNKEAADRLVAAIENLRKAYVAANTVDAKDKIFDTMCALHEELDAIIDKNLRDNDAGYGVITDTLKDSDKQIKAVIDNINQLINYVKIAADVVATLTKVLALLV
jgi:septation ring formation regulator EzrA